jgi:hypothetical protein
MKEKEGELRLLLAVAPSSASELGTGTAMATGSAARERARARAEGPGKALGFPVGPVERDLIPPDPLGEPSDWHRTATAPSGASWQAVGHVSAGPQQSGGLYPPHGAPRTQSRPWAACGCGLNCYFLFFSFTDYSFNSFLFRF